MYLEKSVKKFKLLMQWSLTVYFGTQWANISNNPNDHPVICVEEKVKALMIQKAMGKISRSTDENMRLS
jgi:hypothetical protein